MQESPYKYHNRKDLINILIGARIDKRVDIEGITIEVTMPYLSGPQICNLSGKLGNPIQYPQDGGGLSRWQYFANLLNFCIQNKKEELLLQELFKLENFNNVLQNCNTKNIKSAYETVVACILEHVNKELYFCGYQLRKAGSNVYICILDAPLAIESKKIKNINHDYIKELINRTADDMNMGKYDSVLKTSRTLLEEVFCSVLEKKGVTPSTSGKITDLYGQVKQEYGMKQNQNFDKRVNNLLSGFEKILTSISDMRNEQSDAHGVGSKRIQIAEHHAQLFVNAAIVMADFILSVSEKQNSNPA